MVSYLIKSGICLALLLLFYHLVLEREKMHHFNRFYLLGSILFSFIAPLFVIYIEAPMELIETTETSNQPFIIDITETNYKPVDYLFYFLTFSVIISSLLLIRFLNNLFSILLKIRKSLKIKHKKAILVLVNDAITPHTFWNYIFINIEEYNSQKIEEELLTHELTHVTQKHTFDVLLIEFLKIVFWFNPIFYFLKKSIQLNHEFLADTKVIKNHKNISSYQYLLLNKTAWNNEYYLASNLNYLLTKKRLLMMTKQSSRSKILLKKLAVIPVLAGFAFLFAERVEAEVPNNSYLDSKITKDSPDAIPLQRTSPQKDIKEKMYLIKGDTLKETPRKEYMHNMVVRKKDKNGKLVTKKFYELTDEEKRQLPPPPPLTLKKKKVSKSLFTKLKDGSKYAIWINGKHVKNNVLNKYNHTDFASFSGSFVHNNARNKKFPQTYQYSLSTHAYFNTQNKKAIKNYNKWKKQNNGLIPPPPPSPVVKKGEISNIPPPPVPVSTKVKKGSESSIPSPHSPIIKKGDVSNIPPPPHSKSKKGRASNIPPPPPPMSASELTFKYPNATFYFNGKKINHRKAISITKNNKELSVWTKDVNNKKVIEFATKKYMHSQKTVSIDKINKLTNEQILKLPKGNTKKISYYLDNKLISLEVYNKINKNNIATIHVKRDKEGNNSIYVTRK